MPSSRIDYDDDYRTFELRSDSGELLPSHPHVATLLGAIHDLDNHTLMKSVDVDRQGATDRYDMKVVAKDNRRYEKHFFLSLPTDIDPILFNDQDDGWRLTELLLFAEVRTQAIHFLLEHQTHLIRWKAKP